MRIKGESSIAAAYTKGKIREMPNFKGNKVTL
jgi:hypothetical protein